MQVRDRNVAVREWSPMETPGTTRVDDVNRIRQAPSPRGAYSQPPQVTLCVLPQEGCRSLLHESRSSSRLRW